MTISRDLYILDCEVLNVVVLVCSTLCYTKQASICIIIRIKSNVGNIQVLNCLAITIEVAHKTVILVSRTDWCPLLALKVYISSKYYSLILEVILTCIYIISQSLQVSSCIYLVCTINIVYTVNIVVNLNILIVVYDNLATSAVLKSITTTYIACIVECLGRVAILVDACQSTLIRAVGKCKYSTL